MKHTRINLDPLSDITRFADMMERMFAPAESTNARGIVPMDIMEVDGKVVLRAAVPGFKPEDINITIEGNVLTLSGEYKSTLENKDAKVYRLENQFGSFTRSIRLPKDAQPDLIEADFENGLVTVTIPRIEPAKPEPLRVPIRTSASKAIEPEAEQKA